MASRISQRSLRSSRSFSRLTWKRAMGIAAEARIATMATQMMSSTRVRPDSEWVGGTVWFGRFGMGEGGGREADFSATAAKAPPSVEMTVFGLGWRWTGVLDTHVRRSGHGVPGFVAWPGCGLVPVLISHVPQLANRRPEDWPACC